MKLLFPLLLAAAPAERSAAAGRILDLGPDVLPTVRARLQSADSEVRARISDLLRELELMTDLRDDLAQATSGG